MALHDLSLFNRALSRVGEKQLELDADIGTMASQRYSMDNDAANWTASGGTDADIPAPLAIEGAGSLILTSTGIPLCEIHRTFSTEDWTNQRLTLWVRVTASASLYTIDGIRIRLGSDTSPTNYSEWNFGTDDGLVHGEWRLIYLNITTASVAAADAVGGSGLDISDVEYISFIANVVDAGENIVGQGGRTFFFDDVQLTAETGVVTATFPPIVTITAHGLTTGDFVLAGLTTPATEMTEINKRIFRITSTDANTFSLDDEDASGYSVELTPMTFNKISLTNKAIKSCWDAWNNVRQEVLSMFTWNEASARTTLARKEAAVVISSATAANPIVCTTSTAHGYSSGDDVLIEAMDEMVEINDRFFGITVVSTTTFSITEDGTTYTAESTGGTCKRALKPLKPEPDEWDYKYDIPTDMLRLLGVVYEGGNKYTWAREGDFILSDKGYLLPIRYIKDLKDPTKFGPLLDSTLSSRLALDICEELTQSNTKAEKLLQEFGIIYTSAKRADAQEGSSVPLEEDDWIRTRD